MEASGCNSFPVKYYLSLYCTIRNSHELYPNRFKILSSLISWLGTPVVSGKYDKTYFWWHHNGELDKLAELLLTDAGTIKLLLGELHEQRY